MTTSGYPQATDNLQRAAALLSAPSGREAPALTVAIPFDHSGAWAAQTSFLRSVALSLQRAKNSTARLVILNLSGESGRQALAADVRELLVPIERSVWQSREHGNRLVTDLQIDCVLNLFGPPPQVETAGLVGWIADFQHARLPQFFLPQELADRDRIFREIIQRSHRVLLSSEDAKRDCLRFESASAAKARVHPFPSGFAFQTLATPDVGAVIRKYHLPEKFVLVANQFWAHKNHLCIVEAARVLKERGLAVPFVLTGLPSDYRDPSNGLVSKVLQAVAMGNLRNEVIPLAQVPYADLIALLRHAALIVQPSSFEGWSTTVQDAKALGRPVACSHISVHREQAPQAAGFFDPTAPAELADLLQRIWPSLTAGPDLKAEAAALATEHQFADDYGLALWRTCAEAADASHRARSSPSPA